MLTREDKIGMNLRGTVQEIVNWIHLAQIGTRGGLFSDSIKRGECPDKLCKYQLLKNNSDLWS